MKKKKKSLKYFWLLGIIGFRGFEYFKTADPSSLFYFAYLAFFAYPLISDILKETEDERMIENRRKSNSLALKVAMIFLFIIGFVPVLKIFDVTDTFFIGSATLGVAATILTQVFSFYYFERYSKD